MCWSRFLKKKTFFSDWDIVTTGKKIEKKIVLPLKITSKLWRIWSLAVPVHNFLSHLHFFKVGETMLLKYGNLMLPAENILDLYRVRLSNAAPFCENYTKFYFDTKHKTFGALFHKMCPFWPISNAAPHF